MSGWFSWFRRGSGGTGPSDAMRESNLQLSCSIRRLELARARCEDRIRSLEATIAELERPQNVNYVLRRKQARYSLRMSQNRLGVICDQIAATDARRARNEDIVTTMELQASTTSAIRGLQETAPDIMSGSVDAVREMAQSDQQLQKYEETMNIALEMMNGSEETNAAIREQADDDEARFMRERVLDMTDVSVPEAAVRTAPAGLKASTPVPAAAAAAAEDDDKKHT